MSQHDLFRFVEVTLDQQESITLDHDGLCKASRTPTLKLDTTTGNNLCKLLSQVFPKQFFSLETFMRSDNVQPFYYVIFARNMEAILKARADLAKKFPHEQGGYIDLSIIIEHPH